MEDDVLFARRRRARAGYYCGRDSGRTTAATTPYAHHEVSVKNRNELCSASHDLDLVAAAVYND